MPAAEVTSWLSNLLKAGYIKEEGTKIIDYNEMIFEKLENIRKTFQAENPDEEGAEPGEFVQGLTAEVVEELVNPEEELNKAREEADVLLAEAREQAERICRKAEADAVQIRENASREGRNQGYQEGCEQARIELEDQKRQMAVEEERRERDYRQQVKLIERDLVEVILEVVGKVTHVIGEDKKGLILHLVDNALSRMENSRQFIVRVSREDYQFVADRKDMLLDKVTGSTELEIVKDATLSRNQCFIETDGGIFDCSLDTQLENLITDIKALSITQS